MKFICEYIEKKVYRIHPLKFTATDFINTTYNIYQYNIILEIVVHWTFIQLGNEIRENWYSTNIKTYIMYMTIHLDIQSL